MIKTIKIKIKPNAYPWLRKAAKEVNFVWNWANATSYRALTPYYGKRKYLSGFDLMKLASGATKEFERIGADSINCVLKEFATRRNQFKKLKLRWRKSSGSRKSLGWIPVKPSQMAKRKGDKFRFCGKSIRLFESIDGFKFKEGNIVEDSCGDWYLCMPHEADISQVEPVKSVCGIDLGMKTIATTSDGEKLEARFYRNSEAKLAGLQRRRRFKQAKALHRKIKRQRDHQYHVFSSHIIKTYQEIYIGNVPFNFLKSGNGAKSAYDGSISKLKNMLQYKGQQAGRIVREINESFTTQDCSACGARNGPTGFEQLVVRKWQCSVCKAEHDRDINSAINIAIAGRKHSPPSAGTSPSPTLAVSSAKSASKKHGTARARGKS